VQSAAAWAAFVFVFWGRESGALGVGKAGVYFLSFIFDGAREARRWDHRRAGAGLAAEHAGGSSWAGQQPSRDCFACPARARGTPPAAAVPCQCRAITACTTRTVASGSSSITFRFTLRFGVLDFLEDPWR
jgi:hypothetical protein